MESFFNLRSVVQLVILFSLPVLSVLGTQTLGTAESHIALSVMVVLIATLPVLVAFGVISEKLYPLAIVTGGVALLLSTSLSAPYFRGADIYQEYYFANLVRTNSYWNSMVPHSYNTVLSVVILPPIISIVSGIPLAWVFKLVYPLVFSIVLLVLYHVFKRQTDGKTAYLSVFFFASMFTFYTEMLGLARQQIAEIFLSIILLLIVCKFNIGGLAGTILVILFASSLVLSHYALAFIFIGLAVLAAFLQAVKGRLHLEREYFKKRLKFGAVLGDDDAAQEVSFKGRSFPRVFTIPLIVFCVALTIFWYVYVGNAFVFNNVVTIVERIQNYILKGFLNPKVAQGIFILSSAQKTPFHDTTKILHIFTQGLITLGILVALLRKSGHKFDREYVYFCISALFLLVGAIVFPFVASALNTTRLYHITLLFLAPFCVVGLVALFEMLVKTVSLLSGRKRDFSRTFPLKAFSVFLLVFLLFNTGFVYSLLNIDKSIVDPNWALERGNAKDRLEFYNSYVPPEEVASARWLGINRNPSAIVYSDSKRGLAAFGMISLDEIVDVWKRGLEDRPINESYVYLRKLNTLDNLISGWTTPQGTIVVLNATSMFLGLSENANTIYSSGGSEIYYSHDAT